jgi:hypothetical protein
MPRIISQLWGFVAGYLHFWRESASFQGNFCSKSRRWSVYPAAKPLTFPIQKDGFNVFSCSQYDGHGDLNHRPDVVNSGRACVHCVDCAGRYYNQEARIA